MTFSADVASPPRGVCDRAHRVAASAARPGDPDRDIRARAGVAPCSIAHAGTHSSGTVLSPPPVRAAFDGGIDREPTSGSVRCWHCDWRNPRS